MESATRRLQLDLDTTHEQLNHAKSALQSMAAELQGLQQEVALLRGSGRQTISVEEASDSDV